MCKWADVKISRQVRSARYTATMMPPIPPGKPSPSFLVLLCLVFASIALWPSVHAQSVCHDNGGLCIDIVASVSGCPEGAVHYTQFDTACGNGDEFVCCHITHHPHYKVKEVENEDERSAPTRAIAVSNGTLPVLNADNVTNSQPSVQMGNVTGPIGFGQVIHNPGFWVLIVLAVLIAVIILILFVMLCYYGCNGFSKPRRPFVY